MTDFNTINVLLTSFPGLDLPRTLSIPTNSSTSICEFTSELINRLPSINSRLILTTSSNRAFQNSSTVPISTLLHGQHDSILPLRLSVPLCGGKGGFGSQLRAAGGRMSSRKKKNVGDQNSSNRNLDGRRLRTINEAKALAEYLALKPEMEKKEKEARRKRWEQVVELAEKREEEIRTGNKGRVDGKWVEEKEEAGERAREAVKLAMASGFYRDNLTAVQDLSGNTCEVSPDLSGEESHGSGTMETWPSKDTSISSVPQAIPKPDSRVYFGFDEDDEFFSDKSEQATEDTNRER